MKYLKYLFSETAEAVLWPYLLVDWFLFFYAVLASHLTL